KLNVVHHHNKETKFIKNLNLFTFNPVKYQLIESIDFKDEALNKLYKNQRHLEKDEKGILSFFTDHHVHVVTKHKELMVERPHGHLLISGKLLSGTEDVFATTNWMFGVFQSHIVLGNTNIQKLNNDLRNPLNLQKISGLRIYIRENNTYQLLGIPSVYEMGSNYAKWIYQLNDDILTIKTFVELNQFGQRLEIESSKNKTYDFVLTNQLALGDNEYIRDINLKVEPKTVTITVLDNDFVKSKYPNLKYQYTSPDDFRVSDESLMFGDSYHQGLMLFEFQQKSKVVLDLVASFDKLKKPSFDFEKNHLAYKDFIHSLTGLELKH